MPSNSLLRNSNVSITKLSSHHSREPHRPTRQLLSHDGQPGEVAFAWLQAQVCGSEKEPYTPHLTFIRVAGKDEKHIGRRWGISHTRSPINQWVGRVPRRPKKITAQNERYLSGISRPQN